MNLIDKDKLIDAFKEKQDCFVTSTNCMHTGGRSGGQKVILDIIQSLPVIEERKHGHWENKNDVYFCSACNKEAYWDTDYGQQLFDFCPNCGTRMDEVEG